MTVVKASIGAKIFGAFVAMGVIIGALGVAGYGVLSAAGRMAITTFDGPLMAISYARAAHSDFTSLQVEEMRLLAAPPAEQKAIAVDIADLIATFNEDLDVAAERSFAADEQKIIRDIRPLVDRWRDARTRGDLATLHHLDGEIDAKFDLLIELNTDHSFVGRRQTVTNIGTYRYVTIAATLLALLLAAGITLYLRRNIIRPLKSAAEVARQIAQGRLQTEIPEGGADETGALLASMKVMQDNIRDRMARETALRRSAENRLADALETSREGMILVAPNGNIALVNSALRAFFPAIADRLTPGAQFDKALELIHTQLAAKNFDGAIDASGHAELELADGRWLRMTGSATSEGGSIIFLSDFTAIKEREEGLRRAKAEADRANAAKTRFLANMSHELRTPLNAIIGFSEIIHGQLFGKVGNERYLEYSGDILRSGRHLLAVINDVLDLSKSESGKMALDLKPVNMRDVLDDCVAMVREQCADAGLEFVTHGIEADMPLTGDPAKLRQIFLNLLSNAVKFTEKGGIVSLTMARHADGVAVTVGDTGIGMDPEDIEIAMQPFRQVDNRLERRYEGTGLGLPLTKSLVDLHDGTMDIDSGRGRGTRITIVLPCGAAGRMAEAG